MESNDEFQFRPITRGLGFHSGASNSGKSGETKSGDALQSLPPTPSARKAAGGGLSAQDRADAEARGRVTADSVSRLISSLPTLDFNESDLRKPAAAPAKMIHTPLARTPSSSATPAPAQASGAVVQSAGPVGAPPKQAVIPGIPARDARRMAGGAARSAGPVLPTATPAPAKAKWSLPNFKALASGISIPRPHLALPNLPLASLARPTLPQPGYQDLTQKVVIPRAANLPETVVYDETKFRETPVQLSAALFDLLVVAGTTCIFAVALLLVTNTDLSLVIHNARSDWATRAGILLLFFSVHALYMVGSRSVAGCTLGEWAFDIQLGLPPEQRTAWYPIAICARYVVIVLTGYVVLPVLSMIMGRDITSNLCGLKLYQTVK